MRTNHSRTSRNATPSAAPIRFSILLALFAIFIHPSPLLAGSFPLWGSLKPGKYLVGYRTFFKPDYSRTYKPKLDLLGKARAGDRSRSMQLSIWYPAVMPPGGWMSRFGMYIDLLATEEKKQEMNDSLREIAVQQFGAAGRRWLGEYPSDESLSTLLQLQTAVFREAEPVAGRHPVILLAQGSSQSVFEQSVLCEFLASHGFVVATCPSIGPDGREMPDDPRGVEAQVRDMEFLLGFLREGPVADLSRMGIAGFSFGGCAALIEAMRNTDIRALLSIDSNLGFRGGLDLVTACPDFSIERMGIPLLHLSQAASPYLDNRLLDTLRYSERTFLRVAGLTHFDFTTYAMIAASVPGFVAYVRSEVRPRYEAVCDYVLNYFRSTLEGDSASHAAMASAAVPTGTAEFMKIERKSGEKRPPTYEEFVDLIRLHGIAQAGKYFDAERKRVPDASLFRESTINRLGYEFLYAYQVPKDAIEIFRWNMVAYPGSFNVWDSLGEAYLADGQTGQAIESYKKSLELNPGNANAVEVLKRIQKK